MTYIRRFNENGNENQRMEKKKQKWDTIEDIENEEIGLEVMA